MTPIVWMGGSRRDLIAMPESVKKDFGGALHGLQLGHAPEGAKSLKGKCKGATQVSEDHDGETYRAVYTTEMEGVVYILHCFQKKSKTGIATPQPDLNLIESRLKDARKLHAMRSKKNDRQDG